MKSEKIRRAIGGIDEDIIEAADRKPSAKNSSKVWIKWGSIAAAFVLGATGLFLLPGLLKGDERIEDPITSSVGSDAVIWADNAAYTENEGLTEWNNKTVGYRLLSALEAAQGQEVFAIFARPAIDDTFEWKGKTIAEYYLNMSEESNLPEKLSQLRKEGDALKYGAALYETGTPTGEKWAKALYEERVRFYGEILDKYIVDGQFLQEKLEQDLAAAWDKHDARTAYEEAVGAYLTELAASMRGALPSEVVSETNGVILYFTQDQFAAFTVEGIADWTFDLAVKGQDAEAYNFGIDE